MATMGMDVMGMAMVMAMARIVIMKKKNRRNPLLIKWLLRWMPGSGSGEGEVEIKEKDEKIIFYLLLN